MSLLSIIQRSAREIGLSDNITRVIGNTNQLVAELLECATQTGEALPSISDWVEMRAEWIYTTVATETQTGAIPSDFDHFIADTLWNRTSTRQLNPVTAEEWQRIKATTANAVVDNVYIRGTSMLMSPVPAAGDILAGEYIKKAYATSADGLTDRTVWTYDEDLPLLPENIFVFGTALRYKTLKGLDANDTSQKYADAIDSHILKNKIRKRINMDGVRQSLFGAIVPEGDWNVS